MESSRLKSTMLDALQGHRDNLLNPAVDRLGVAVVARGSRLYAVEDFSRGVQVLTMEQVEARISSLMQENGIAAHVNSVGARLACAQDHGLPVSLDNRRPEFIMRWQDAELQRLPGALLDRMQLESIMRRRWAVVRRKTPH